MDSEIPEDLSHYNILILDLTTRATNCLRNGDIHTIGQLTGKTEAELLHRKGLGVDTLAHIKEKLANFGLALREAETPPAEAQPLAQITTT